MQIRTRTTMAAAAVALAATGLFATPVFADNAAPEKPEAVPGTLTPEEEARVHREVGNAQKVDMYYHGKKIDSSSDDLGGAQVCAEVSEDGTMECFDSSQEANSYLARQAPSEQARQGARAAATTYKYEDCPSSWVCLWQDANFSGRRLQWPTYPQAKTRHLDQYSPSFRDKASSAYVNRPQRGVTLYDFRTGMPDPHLYLGAGYTMYPNFKKISYAYGGNWNDKADAIKF
ncbi:peptidase inhibitor family I36 protein [Streptomyces sp. CT34]|uniref:peptidase inhibitor family I36 protein n=1 Tax=Streptomyces sp. CT34 TaxID=1553907 RepID=UPI0005B8C7C7|nr:peptidase inhibitor family I36 protein [Streptomyces sp. CT34]